ncbi:kinase-like domain-containing protein [Cercophora scortea]|uniref:Kinase-like domain-containing protein n=1 Tax=Cercophora scortea TaxID=314031 RepID=A0AAE0IAX2_9PEZI|nr:kinase-like domain-containing protein [Cercophora scortea]
MADRQAPQGVAAPPITPGSHRQATLSRFGLRDTERVDRIHRERLFRGNHEAGDRDRATKTIPTITPPSGYESLSKIIETISDKLYQTGIQCISSKWFVTRSSLESILTPEKVLQIVSRLKFFEREPQKHHELANDICFGTKSSAPCLKLLAVLIRMNQQEEMKGLMDQGMSDECLPLTAAAGNRENKLVCYHLAESHTVINELKWSGAFSKVFKVKIPSENHDLGESELRHPDGYFALKELNYSNREAFDSELQSLLFIQDSVASEAKRHIIQLLASFEVYNRVKRTYTYYFFFDWADGTLEDFWKSNENMVGKVREHSPWMSQQFLGLAKALQHIHGDNGGETSQEGSSSPKLYGRHNDIKPDNIVWFRDVDGGRWRLVLTDFGQAKLHTKNSRSYLKRPQGRTGVPTYVAPEFYLTGGRISRAADKFNLGCVFLNHITWILKGFHAVDREFPLLRLQTDAKTKKAGDNFFRLTRVSGPGQQNTWRADQKPSVLDWIKELKQHEKDTKRTAHSCYICFEENERRKGKLDVTGGCEGVMDMKAFNDLWTGSGIIGWLDASRSV